MKKLIFFLFILISFKAYSQSPSNFTYQSVVRDGSGKLLSNKEISFRISVLKNSESGQVVFEEEHSVTTNINGLATLIVGKGSGNDDLGDIDWGDGSYFLKVEIDPEGGFNFIAEDTTQLLSVPYALYSSSSGSSLTITGQDYLSISNNEITVNQIDLSDDVVGILPVVNGGTGSSTAPMVGVITAADAASARNVLELSTVASTGSYNDLTDKLTAGTNIDITNGVISSTDTNTTYTAGTGISIDGNNAISTTVTDTDTVRSVTAGGNTLADGETLAFTAGSNVTITENAGAVTISSTDTNTTYTAGTGISIDGNNAISTTITDTDTVRSVTAGGNTLADGETLAFTAGSNVTITENAGAVTISSTDTNTTYSVGDGGLTQNNFTNALKSKLDGLNTPAIYDNSGSPALETGITAAEIRSLIGVDASGSDNSTNVTLSGSYDYLTLSGQAITLGQITNDDLAGSIADSKLNQITTANKVAGSSVELASGSALANSSGLDVTVDDSSIENNSGTLRVKADGISNSMIADPELKEFAAMTPASTGQYNFIAGTGDNFQALTVPETLTALGAGTMATQNKESVNIDGGEIELSALNIDGGTDIGAAITDSDLIIIDDGGGGTNRKAAVSRLKTYIESSTSTSIDDLSDGKSGGTGFTDSMILGHTTTGTLTNALQNTAVGIDAMKSIERGDDNTAVGFEALQNNTNASRNTAVGSKALWYNSSAYDNIAVGYKASYSNMSGDDNIAIGSEALYSNLSSSQNLAIGTRALYDMENTGEDNTAIGYYAGSDGNSNIGIRDGDKNVLIGHQSGVDNTNAQNRIVIGQGARGLADHSVVLGNTNVTAVYMAQDSGATVYAGGLNLSGGTTVSGILYGTVTMSTNAEQTFTISGVTSNSIVTASFKSGANNQTIQSVVPSDNNLTITLSGTANGAVIMYIIIN